MSASRIDAVDLTSDPVLWSHDVVAFVNELEAKQHPLATLAATAIAALERLAEVVDECNRDDRYGLHIWSSMAFAEIVDDLARAVVAGGRGELQFAHAVAICEAVIEAAVDGRAELVAALKAVAS